MDGRSNTSKLLTTDKIDLDMSTPVVVDHDTILHRENSYEAKALIPVVVYLVILMVIGLIGNTIVLYVYKFRFRRSTSRVFILSLASFDLITCIFGMPYHILDLMFPYEFYWSAVCKTLSFALTFTISGSIFVLDLIAVDRYRKICTPLEKQLSSKGTKIVCWVTVLISGIFALPILFLYGTANVETRITNVTGKECYISDAFVDTSFPLVYDVFNIIVFVVSVLVLSVLYTKVAISVRKRKKFNDSHNGTQKPPSCNATPLGSVRNMATDDTLSTPLGSLKEKHGVARMGSNVSSVKSHPTASDSPYNSPRIPRKGKKDTPFKKKLMRMMSDMSSSEYDSGGTLERGQRSHEPSRCTSKKQRRTLRITTMLFVITLIFIISFLPYLIIQILNNLDEDFWKGMNTSELVIYNFLMRTYFVNNMVNPIVYWCLDRKFKDEVVKLFSRLRLSK